MSLSLDMAHRAFLQCLQGVYKKNFDSKAASQALTLDDLRTTILPNQDAMLATNFLTTLEAVGGWCTGGRYDAFFGGDDDDDVGATMPMMSEYCTY